MAGPHRFEQAITLSRLIGAAAVLSIAPFIPNLGPAVIGLLAASLVVSAIVLHVLATRVRTAEDVQRLSWAVFAWDVVIVGLAQLAMTPDELWPAIALIGVLLVISTAFRLGESGAIASAASEIAVVLGMSAWRQSALAIPVPVPYIGFDILMFVLAAMLMTSMLREFGILRRERVDLMKQVGDVEVLRRSSAEQQQLLQQERDARTRAELAVVRLEAVRRITDQILRHASIDELLASTLESVARLSGARTVAVLGASEQGVLVRASFGLEHQVRRPIAPQGDLADAMRAAAPTIVLDDSLAALDAHVSDRIESRILVPLPRANAQRIALYVGFSRRQEFSAEDRALLSLIAERVEMALDRVERAEADRRAREAAEAAVERSDLLLAAADTVLRSGDGGEALDRLVHLAVPRLADACALYLLREDGELACVALAADDTGREQRARSATIGREVPRPRHPLWSVVRSGEARLIERVGPEDIVLLALGSEHLRLLLDPSLTSWLAVPVLEGSNVAGVLELSSASSSRIFSPDDLATARSFGARLAVAVARARAIR
jgi:GAF domain-containing protein